MNPKPLRRLLLLIGTALVGIGVVAVYSSSALVSEATYGGSLHFLANHAAGIGCGVALGLGCLALPYGRLQQSAKWCLLISLLLLVGVSLFGQEAGGAKRWFRMGRWSIQPSEPAQLALVLYLADVLARKAARIREFWHGFMPPMVATGATSVLVLIQPDLGTTVAMGAVAVVLLMVARARWRHLALVGVVALLALVVLIAGAEYRRRRILAFLDPWNDPLGVGYQIIQSYLSLGSGGLLGQGIGGSLQKLFFLPSAHTDFIFAVIGEELGLVGTTLVIGLFGVFMTCGLRIALAAQDLFSKYLVCGIVALIGLEAMVNIAVVTGLLPTKGLPLPFISYGGSSMIMNLVACALLFRASRHGERISDARALHR